MEVRVRFRFNKRTGEVEEFLVDDQDRRLPEHVHDQVALEMAGVVVLNAEIQEVLTTVRARPPLPPIDDTRPIRDAGTIRGRREQER